MIEGKYTRWGMWAKGHELDGDVNIVLLSANFSRKALLELIEELMAIRARMPKMPDEL